MPKQDDVVATIHCRLKAAMKRRQNPRKNGAPCRPNAVADGVASGVAGRREDFRQLHLILSQDIDAEVAVLDEGLGPSPFAIEGERDQVELSKVFAAPGSVPATAG